MIPTESGKQVLSLVAELSRVGEVLLTLILNIIL